MTSSIEPQPAAPTPQPPRFQYSLRTLFLLFVVLGSSLGLYGAGGIVVFGLAVALAIRLHHAASIRKAPVVAFFLICFCSLLLSSAVRNAHEEGQRASCEGHMCWLALGLRNCRDTNGSFPPAFVADINGHALLSWRVCVLPYMRYDKLYKSLDLTQPWDAPRNKNLLATHLNEYACPSEPSSNAPGATQTNYLAVVGANAAWTGETPRTLADFGNEAANTVLLIEADNPGIQWAEPRDLSLDMISTDEPKVRAMLSSPHGHYEGFFCNYDYGSGVWVAMADGSLRWLRTDNLSAAELRESLEIGGFKQTGTPPFHGGAIVHRRPNWSNIAALGVWLVSVGALLATAVRSRKQRTNS